MMLIRTERKGKDTRTIVFMNNSVQEVFPESCTREHKHFNSLNILIGDPGFPVPGADKRFDVPSYPIVQILRTKD